MTKQEARKYLHDYAKTIGTVPMKLKEAIDALVSPEESEHLPEGTICKVWMDVKQGGPQYSYLAIADGNGEFCEMGALISPSTECWDHYRVIPTAEDALKAIRQRRKEINSQSVKFVELDRGLDHAEAIVMALIEGAKEA